MAANKRPARPKARPADIQQKGIEALGLATEHREAIEGRLAAGAVDGLAADLAQVGAVVPLAVQARLERIGATAEQVEAALQAKRLVMAIRESIASSDLDAAARKAWGTGSTVNPKVIKSVVAAADIIIARATAKPDEARTAGVLPGDIESLRAAVATTRNVDSTQESRKASSKNATRDRDATLVRIESTIKKLSAAGQLAFAGSPAIAARYAALGASGTSRKKKAEEPRET